MTPPSNSPNKERAPDQQQALLLHVRSLVEHDRSADTVDDDRQPDSILARQKPADLWQQSERAEYLP